jgi:hypothetical protein
LSQLACTVDCWEKGDANEYLDNHFRGAADRLDQRIHCVPRLWRANSPVAYLCGNFSGLAFRDGETCSLTIHAAFLSVSLRCGLVSGRTFRRFHETTNFITSDC